MLNFARAVLRQEAAAIEQLALQIGDEFSAAATRILMSEGYIIVTGVGKSLLVGEKISATLASTGTPSITIHPTDAMHGDIGRMRRKDILLALSNSGETVELTQLVDAALRLGVVVIVMTSNGSSSLAQKADIVLNIGSLTEACPLGLAPSTSTTVMMALGDALALTLVEQRGFTHKDFARLHPAGALGQRLRPLAPGGESEEVPAGFLRRDLFRDDQSSLSSE